MERPCDLGEECCRPLPSSTPAFQFPPAPPPLLPLLLLRPGVPGNQPTRCWCSRPSATSLQSLCDENARKDLKTLPAFPTKTLQEHPSLAYCEDRVIEHYLKIKGLTRGQAVVQYMKIVEALPTYGVHYYAVKDKQGLPWWLGISYKGIGQYDLQDKVKPRKLFQWKQLENLYFREKKFAVEVHDPRR
uniref:FERM domain-containing protein 4B-like isoform X1 n=1 Tax=Halichoerus grypus TaxID=9711 RepID=UPI001658F020|nr:FERM domain-containing protein 4B-like isoform X1 [Halichoerus grypus]